jgi:hypothetical protein
MTRSDTSCPKQVLTSYQEDGGKPKQETAECKQS